MIGTKASPGSHVRVAPRADAVRDKPLRVLFCLDTFHVGGTELNAVRTLERLTARGIEVHVACLREEGPLLERVKRANVPIHRFSIPSLLSLHTIAEGVRFREFVRRGGYDIVHAHDMYSNMLFVPWARLARNAGVIASRRWWNDMPRAAHRVLNRWSYHFAHRVLVNSPAIGSLVQHSEHISGDRVVVITNFVDHEMFNDPAESYLERMRSELAITADAIVIGIVANLHEVKEHWVLLDAVARLTPRWPQLRVILIGDGTCRAELEEQARRLGLERHVVFAGTQPHHPSPNYLFDIAVLTSRAEGFPNAIVEAMAAGRPVVATAVGGVPDAVVEGETGFLVPPSQPEPLANALEALLRDPTRREAMGAAARKRAIKLYDAEAVIASLESLYDSIADPRRLVR